MKETRRRLPLASGSVFAPYLTGSGHLIPRFGSRRFTAYSISIAGVATLVHFLVFHPVAELLVSADILDVGGKLGQNPDKGRIVGGLRTSVQDGKHLSLPEILHRLIRLIFPGPGR